MFAERQEIQSFQELAVNATFTFCIPPPLKSPPKRPNVHDDVPSQSPSPSPKRRALSSEPATLCKQDADHEEELADVDDDGKAQRKITNFFQKETREETLARIRREDEQNALTHEQRQRDAEQDKQLKLDKKREDA
jgi:hypothetical protein